MNVIGVKNVGYRVSEYLPCRTKLKTIQSFLKPLAGYSEKVDSFTKTGSDAFASKVISRKNLQSTNGPLKLLAGPKEKSDAKAWLAVYTLGNAGLAAAMAQEPGLDEAALSAVEVGMAAHILRGIYKFDIGDTAIKSLLTGCTGAYVGTKTFKLASKSITWIPLIGNGLNALVSGTTTAALGASIIAIAEKMDAARKRGKKMDDIINAIENENKNKKGKK